ncbi:MAG TPA: FAD/NAD(P)-binding protein [Verrucomicrobiae bacterium]|nr:FAD/NAD(P)-binding protein [Verrucomicrobiae bacterium]
MDSASLYDVAVVGGGLAGTTLVAELALVAPPDFRVLLIDAGEPGPGSAYAPASDALFMNGPARAMSATAADKEELLRWLGSQDREALIPRRLFGRYLAERFARALAGRPLFDAIRSEVVDLEPDAGGFRILDARGDEWSARCAVLALGNFPPDDSFLPEALRSSRGFVSNPWTFDPRKATGDVLVVGGGLTALDAVAQLDERGFSGTIHIVSRHGLLPHVENPAARALDRSALDLKTQTPLALLRSLRAAVRRHAAAGGDWREVLESIREISQEIWGGWSQRERRRFLEHLQAFWTAHRYRVPPATASVFERLDRAGRIVRHRGRVAAARALRDGRLSVEIANAACTTVVAIASAINCTGPNGDYARIRHALVRNLVRRGLLRPDPLHLGLDANDELRVLDRRGAPSERLFAIGPPLRGLFYETTAVPETARQAARLAQALAQEPSASALEAAS